MYSYCKYIQDIKVFGEVRPQWDLSIPSTYTSRSNHFKHYKKCHVSSRWKEDISSFVKSQYQSWITFYLQWVLRTTGWVWWHFIQSVNALESHTTHNPAASIGFSKVHLLQFFHDLGPKAKYLQFVLEICIQVMGFCPEILMIFKRSWSMLRMILISRGSSFCSLPRLHFDFKIKFFWK